MKRICFNIKTFFAILCAFMFVGCNKTTAELIDVVSVDADAKWEQSIIFISFTWHPKVTVKFQNNSNKTITNPIMVKCQFIENDEIVGEDSQILNSANGTPWENGLSKTLEFNYSGKTATVFDMAAKNVVLPPRIKAKIFYDDNSPVWEGYFEPVAFNPDDPYGIRNNKSSKIN